MTYYGKAYRPNPLENRNRHIRRISTLVGKKFSSRIVRLNRPLDVYKKVEYFPKGESYYAECIAFLHLPKDTLLHYDLYHSKLRSDMAIVAGFSKVGNRYESYFKSSFEYIHGAIVTPVGKFSMTYRVCESGIHCFYTYKEALEYDFC